ncbi:MAG: integrase family protein [Candidatus Accumulibacter sp. UW20]|jgi:integrase
MNRERLTPDRIRRLTLPEGAGQFFLWDTEAPRLAVRVTAGAKSFIFESKLNRQTVRVTIGDVRAWILEAARDKARLLQTMIDQGIDPRQEKRDREAEAARKIAEAEAQAAALVAEAEAAKREQEKRQRYTLRTLCEAYCDLLQARGKPSARQARSIFKVHAFEAHPDIAATPARDVTSLQVAAMVRKTREAGHERAAGVLRSYLSAAFTAGKKAPFDASLPAALIPFEIERNPVDAIPAIAVRAGNRTLSADELRAYLAALGDNLADQALLLALLAGGQRMAQLLRAKTSDYDPDAQTLRLWDGKGRRTSPREHLLPLAPRAAALVAQLIARAEAKRSPLLFSSHGQIQLTDTTPGKRAAEIGAAMTGEPFDLRDIRRTCETMLASLGISRDTRAQLLSHGLSGVQATHYDRHGYTEEKRAALVAWENRLREIETGERAAGNVVALRTA